MVGIKFIKFAEGGEQGLSLTPFLGLHSRGKRAHVLGCLAKWEILWL